MDFNDQMLQTVVDFVLDSVEPPSIEGILILAVVMRIGVIINAHRDIVIEITRGVSSVINNLISTLGNIVIVWLLAKFPDVMKQLKQIGQIKDILKKIKGEEISEKNPPTRAKKTKNEDEMV